MMIIDTNTVENNMALIKGITQGDKAAILLIFTEGGGVKPKSKAFDKLLEEPFSA